MSVSTTSTTTTTATSTVMINNTRTDTHHRQRVLQCKHARNKKCVNAMADELNQRRPPFLEPFLLALSLWRFALST